jgi:glycosyltransferase involved in cell wall biosynthesis
LKKFSIIIAYYKNPTALELILKALELQSFQDFEVIIAEDDVPSIFTFVDKINYPIKHVHQKKDIGFTKNATLNKALRVADGKYIIFVDGDCIPHRHFVKAYDKWMKDDIICFGRRVMIGPETTAKLYQSKDLMLLSWKNLWKSDSRRLKYGLYLPFIRQKRKYGIWGHNWCVAKEKLVIINGFDEDYQTAGVGEDVDIEWRLLASGLQLYSIRFAAIQYHLHHRENYNNISIETGMKQFKAKKKFGNVVCLNGYNNAK